MAHQVFLSHATEDRETALQVCSALESEGIRCWIAPRDVPAGTDYAAAILDGIRTSDLVLLVFSVNADSSPYVLREIERAVAYKRPVLALRLDDTAPRSPIEYYVNAWRTFDASHGIDAKRTEIVSAVRAATDTTQPAAKSRGTRRMASWSGWNSRRRWIAATAIVLAVIAMATGLVLGPIRDHPPSSLGPAADHVAWTVLRPEGPTPTARRSHEMVADPTSGRLIVFGGFSEGSGDSSTGAANDTWAYDPAANAWTELHPTGPLPPARGMTAMAYDPATRKIIMFGGHDGLATPLADTWAFDPVADTWTELSTGASKPEPRAGEVLVYDPQGSRLLMFGGRSGETEFLNDLWALDTTVGTWTRLAPGGAPPTPRARPAMAYDPATRRFILFGGWSLEAEFGDTWAYDPVANAWTEMHPSGVLPSTRSDHSLILDPSQGMLVMFGGAHDPGTGIALGELNETWTYEPNTDIWAKTQVSQEGARPVPRTGQSMAYDPSGGRLIIFGGESTVRGLLNDLWACTF